MKQWIGIWTPVQSNEQWLNACHNPYLLPLLRRTSNLAHKITQTFTMSVYITLHWIQNFQSGRMALRVDIIQKYVASSHAGYMTVCFQEDDMVLFERVCEVTSQNCEGVFMTHITALFQVTFPIVEHNIPAYTRGIYAV